MTTHTLSAHAICKNEINHIGEWYESISPLVDEIIMVDTGSTDGTVEWLKDKADGDPKLKLFHFEWINDFSAARNFALSKVTSQYALFIDLDDRIHEREAFLSWKSSVMSSADYWMAVYQYAPTCSFARERVFRTDLGLKWSSFLHEGIAPTLPNGKQAVAQYVTSWRVTHLRTEDDLKKDRSRNISIMEYHKAKGKLDSRMTYYYGKELFEADKPLEAFTELLEAASRPDLEGHDRILSLQYACMSAMRLNQFEKAISLAHQGMQLSPNRAEFYVVVGDCYLKLNQPKNAIPYYESAKTCRDPEVSGQMRGAIFSHEDSYSRYPRLQLCRVHFHLGDLEACKIEVEKLIELFPNDTEAKALTAEYEKIKKLTHMPKVGEAPASRDIVISCPPGGFYEWSENVSRERGMGGSEIAAIHMARELHEITGRTVRVYNSRKDREETNGVIYAPVTEMNEWLSQNIPALHIAWRHNIKVTNAKTVLWCHDLYCPGIENTGNYEKLAVLSPFHKKYVQGLFDIPDSKIFLTANGVANFSKFKAAAKRPYKVIYASSPDRGLDHVIAALDIVKAKGYLVELHVFYGFENMITMGKNAEAQKYLDLVNKRAWIVNHGNTLNSKLPQMYSDACLWLYPTNFTETFCINALEMVLSGIYPIFRDYGAVPDTLAEYLKLGMAEKHNVDPSDSVFWAERVISAIEEKKWEKVKVSDPSKHSWQNIASSWIKQFNL